jgi:isoaspartyl peptidase/L-asparaginase-like protein (Ntn-hydrolase superfamily)
MRAALEVVVEAVQILEDGSLAEVGGPFVRQSNE